MGWRLKNAVHEIKPGNPGPVCLIIFLPAMNDQVNPRRLHHLSQGIDIKLDTVLEAILCRWIRPEISNDVA